MADYCDRWGPLLTKEESRALIEEVNRWCQRTGTNYNKLVVVADVRPSVRHMIRMKGKRVTPDTAARLRETMRQHRYGISREEYRAKPKPWGTAVVEALSPLLPELVRVESTQCGRCGARTGQCEHTRQSGRRLAAG